MALYRLHKVEWEQQVRQSTDAWKAKNGKGREEGAPETANPGKRKRDADIDDMGEEVEDVDEGARKRAVDFPGLVVD